MATSEGLESVQPSKNTEKFLSIVGQKRMWYQVSPSGQNDEVPMAKKTYPPKAIQNLEDLPEEGDFKYGDVAWKVLDAKINEQGIFVLVQWKRRRNGVLPKQGIFSSTVVRE